MSSFALTVRKTHLVQEIASCSTGRSFYCFAQVDHFLIWSQSDTFLRLLPVSEHIWVRTNLKHQLFHPSSRRSFISSAILWISFYRQWSVLPLKRTTVNLHHWKALKRSQKLLKWRNWKARRETFRKRHSSRNPTFRVSREQSTVQDQKKT